MNNNIKFYRVILNILFYIFYVLIVSISFSFIFPSILVIIGKDVIDPTNPIFDGIQIAIIILVLITSIIYRKYFYLPIRIKSFLDTKKDLVSKNNEKIEKENNEPLSEELELDIKIGKEIK